VDALPDRAVREWPFDNARQITTKGRNAMEYVKPTLTLAGSAHAIVLGSKLGDGDHAEPTEFNTRPSLVSLGLADSAAGRGLQPRPPLIATERVSRP
jgi:hypothetical protein